MTDMEGVAGVLDTTGWCTPGGAYYENGKALLTGEVNAAVEGFFDAGADEILVADGHGWGGINHELLDPRVEVLSKWTGGYLFGLDDTFDCMAHVGQHAKAQTPMAHLCHTGNMTVLDLSINGLSVGEFGQLVLCAGELGVRAIFAAGDRAFTGEAQALVPGIETAEVKRGLTPGAGDECDADAYRVRNVGAIHVHPEVARERIREGARRALLRAQSEDFGVRTLDPPWSAECRYRPDKDFPFPTVARASASSDLADLICRVKRDAARLPLDPA